MLQDEGAEVRVYDPQAMPNARRAYPDLAYGESALEAAAEAEVVVLLTEWDQFRAMDPAELGKVVASRVIVDGRHALDPAEWRRAGWRYRALGRQGA
jgi:UDPglucose 6-dehydrogenase